eukprot:3575800-Prymnesium_polylepis.2
MLSALGAVLIAVGVLIAGSLDSESIVILAFRPALGHSLVDDGSEEHRACFTVSCQDQRSISFDSLTVQSPAAAEGSHLFMSSSTAHNATERGRTSQEVVRIHSVGLGGMANGLLSLVLGTLQAEMSSGVEPPSEPPYPTKPPLPPPPPPPSSPVDESSRRTTALIAIVSGGVTGAIFAILNHRFSRRKTKIKPVTPGPVAIQTAVQNCAGLQPDGAPDGAPQQVAPREAMPVPDTSIRTMPQMIQANASQPAARAKARLHSITVDLKGNTADWVMGLEPIESISARPSDSDSRVTA